MLALMSAVTMVKLAQSRTARFGLEDVQQTSGAPQVDLPNSSFDRFISSYVLDLLWGVSCPYEGRSVGRDEYRKP
jgi:hypothetical protein